MSVADAKSAMILVVFFLLIDFNIFGKEKNTSEDYYFRHHLNQRQCRTQHSGDASPDLGESNLKYSLSK